MFIKYIFIPHLEDTYLDLGPDIMSLCTREFVINVNTNSTQVTYEQTSGEPMVINVSNPFLPVINIEQVRGKFTLVAYGDDETTDSVNILSGPIDNTLPITQTTKIGLPPVSVFIVGIYTQKLNQFFRWRDTGGKIKWGDVSFLPSNVTSIKSYRLDNNLLIIDAPLNDIVFINSDTVFGLEVKYNIGGNISSRYGGNWFFDNNAQVDERWALNQSNTSFGNTSRLIYVKQSQIYQDTLNSINHTNKSTVSRIVYSKFILFYDPISKTWSTIDATGNFNALTDSLIPTYLTTKGNSSRIIYTDRIIA